MLPHVLKRHENKPDASELFQVSIHTFLIGPKFSGLEGFVISGEIGWPDPLPAV
jgi:hypothetical protein